MNEKVGEFIYNVEAKATLPQISALPFKPGPHTVRISSAAAASTCQYYAINTSRINNAKS